ncbi:carboxylate-amine ligase [Curvivirga sp.]|uniref:carboxylate-amine ligase n=1 Tax=Curvivirga sp. TaxID=2856848 RepID=UPI003B5B6D18
MIEDTSPITLGIEEEYLLVDPVTRNLTEDAKVQEAVIEEVQANVSDDVGFATPEFLKAQVEIGTSVCHSAAEAREKLVVMRKAVAQAASNHGLAPIAASTHPMANWQSVQHTDKERYKALAADLQSVGQRLVICGMHVHVGIEKDEHRIDLMNQISYFLPHLLALSGSSPFWRGRNTGLSSYRIAVFDELPRTGLPEKFESWAEYQNHLNVLIDAGVIEDGSKLWWDIRPHCRFPTLEMRLADICTRLDDGVAIAALYASLISMLQRLRKNNQRWRIYNKMLVNENRWRAQRYGHVKGLIDFGRGEIISYSELLEEMIDLTKEDQERLGCVAEVAHARTILERGTSAQNQVRVYDKAITSGASEEQALHAVVDWLIKETVTDL